MKTHGIQLSALLLLSAVLLLPAQESPLATLERTIDTGEELPVLAAWSPDNARLAYATEAEVSRHQIRVKEDRDIRTYPGEVWLTDFTDKPERILKRRRFRERGGGVPSFSITHLNWSPDGQKLAVELRAGGETATLLLTTEGKPVKVGSGGGNILEGYDAAWLGDSESVALLYEVLQPRLLHSVGLLRVTAGRILSLFRDKTFAAVAWLPQSRQAVMVERDKEFAEPPRLVLGNLDDGTLEPLDELSEGYLGGLQATPDETRVSYFVGQQKLAVRSLAPTAEVDDYPIPFGTYRWLDNNRLLFLEPEEIGSRKGWLTFYDRRTGEQARVLPETLLHNFWLSPDGRRLAVLTADSFPQLKIYRLTLPGE